MRIIMFSLILFSCAGIASVDFIYRIPDGHYAGQGHWRDNHGNEGGYATYVELSNNTMRVDYRWEQQSLTVYLAFDFIAARYFDVIHEGSTVGHGHCEINLYTCEIDAPSLYYAEELTFGYDILGLPTLSKTGKKHMGDRLVEWSDGLGYANLRRDHRND